ncbi:MAG: CHAT domain-containing protein [Salinibacter sp.]
MIALLLGILLVVPAPDTTDNLDTCLSMEPDRGPSSVTTLNEAQKTWLDHKSVSRDTLRAHLSRIQEARQCYRRLNPSEVARPYIEKILDTYETEAVLHAALRQFPKAFEAYKAGLSYLQSHDQGDFAGYKDAKAEWSPIFHQLQAYLHYLLGNLSASIEQYLHAFEANPSPSGQINHLLSAGTVLQRTQDYRSARHYYRRAQRRLQREDLPPKARTNLQALVYHAQADLLLEQTLNTSFDQGALKKARDLARQGRRLAEPGTERHARTSLVLSESLGYLGAFEEAYRLNSEVRDYARTENDARLHSFALLKLGVLHLQTERWAQADSALSEALTRAENLNNLDLQRRVLRALGRLHEMKRDWVRAEAYYRNGIAVIEEYRASLTASQWSATAFSQWRDVHHGLVRTLLAQDRHREALRALDRTRARHLQDLRTQARVAKHLPPSQRARFDSLTRALTKVRNQLAQESLASARETALQNRETTLMADRQQILNLDSVARRPEVTDLQTALDQQNRVLVSYFLDDPWPVYGRSPRSAAFVLTPDTLRTVPLPNLTQDSVRAQIEATSDLFVRRDKPTGINEMHFDLRPLHNLQKALYAPIADYLPDGRPLTVVPSGPLFRIPFSMLVRSMPGGRYVPAQARYILHERPTTLELASSLIVDSTRSPPLGKPSAQAKLAAFGVSEFDTLRSVPTALRINLPSTSPVVLPDLPGVRAELRAVDRRVPRADVFLDSAATERAFRNRSRRADVLHLASHAFSHPSSPLQNAFLLQPDSSRRSTDGVLFLHELRAQNRPVSFVVLSGCNTARGMHRGGEGMEGLQYAFQAMGAEATLSSLWPVADQTNVELIDAFYQHLKEGLRKDEALRQAKLEYLASHPARASPFFWAPTVLYGSPARLKLGSSLLLPTMAWWGLGLVFVGLGGVLVWRVKKRLENRSA